MRNGLLLHGMPDKEEYFDSSIPSPSNNHWFPWLQHELLINGIFTQTPEMPQPYHPQYDLWQKEFERFEVNQESILIGHSCGAGFLVRWLTENKINLDTLILAAPWLDPDKSLETGFFEFDLDPKLFERAKRFHILVSNDDSPDILKSVKILEQTYKKATIHRFDHYGHLTLEGLGHPEFPELLKIILGNNNG